MSSRFAGRAALFALLVVAPAPALRAQGNWDLEVRGGPAFPTQDLGPLDLDTGVGLEATLQYRLLPHVAAYAGWDWMHFGSSAVTGADVANDLDVEVTGYALGLRFEHPFSGETGPGPAYWVRAGATIDHAEVEDGGGEVIDDSGHGLGWEAGGGLSLAVGRHARLRPGVRYRSLTRDLDFGAGDESVDLSYVSVEVGFAWRL